MNELQLIITIGFITITALLIIQIILKQRSNQITDDYLPKLTDILASFIESWDVIREENKRLAEFQKQFKEQKDGKTRSFMEKDIEIGMGDKFIDYDGMIWMLMGAKEDAICNGYMYYDIQDSQNYIMHVNKSIIRQMMKGKAVK